jgi:lipopolysaccharide biosynthesis glycosyltransferase
MKYVYVLTSSENDAYYEQFLLSLTSFRFYNPDAHIVILIDSKTSQNLVGKRSAHEKVVSEIQAISAPAEFSQKEASRWIKTSIHHYVSGDFLFIDCDTIICDTLIPDFSPDIQIGAVLDTHATLDKHHLRDNFRKEDTQAGFCSSIKSNVRYNGGLIFCKGDPAANNFFEKWHTLWIDGRNRGCSQDMPSLNQANYELGGLITELPGKWNCQIAFNGLPFLHRAKIIHYYATSLVSFSSAYSLSADDVFASIKTQGRIPPDTLKLLNDPKSAFMEKSRIVADEAVLDILDSAYFQKLLWLRRKHKHLFFLLNNIVSRIKKPLKIKKIEKNPH